MKILDENCEAIFETAVNENLVENTKLMLLFTGLV